MHLRKSGHMLLCAALAISTASCNVPRGAAVSSQILRNAEDVDADFAVVPVDKSNIDRVKQWPGHAAPGARWIGNKRGPASAVLRAGDSVNIQIWDNTENSLLVREGQKTNDLAGLVIGSAGDVFIPYVGSVVVNGQTVEQARRTIEERVHSVAPSAQVTLTAASGIQSSVDLVSGMAKPGSYPLVSRNQTILSMLAMGGGIRSGMRNPIVRLIRDGSTYEISARRLLEDGSLDTVLRGGDKVLVSEDERFFTSLGATGSEKLIYFDKDTITALEAVSIAGGLLDQRADPKGVLILRDYDAKSVRQDGSGPSKTKVVFTFDLTSAESLFAARSFLVHPKDTVLVSESSLPAAQSLLGILGSGVGLTNALTNN